MAAIADGRDERVGSGYLLDATKLKAIAKDITRHLLIAQSSLENGICRRLDTSMTDAVMATLTYSMLFQK